MKEKSENKCIVRAMAIDAKEFKLHGDIVYNLSLWFCAIPFGSSFCLMPPALLTRAMVSVDRGNRNLEDETLKIR